MMWPLPSVQRSRRSCAVNKLNARSAASGGMRLSCRDCTTSVGAVHRRRRCSRAIDDATKLEHETWRREPVGEIARDLRRVSNRTLAATAQIRESTRQARSGTSAARRSRVGMLRYGARSTSARTSVASAARIVASDPPIDRPTIDTVSYRDSKRSQLRASEVDPLHRRDSRRTRRVFARDPGAAVRALPTPAREGRPPDTRASAACRRIRAARAPPWRPSAGRSIGDAPATIPSGSGVRRARNRHRAHASSRATARRPRPLTTSRSATRPITPPRRE